MQSTASESLPSTSERPRYEGRRAAAKRELADAMRSFPRFCGLLDVLDKAGRRVKLRLNRTQRRYVAAMTNRDVVLKGRQVGLSTIIIARMLWYFLTVKGSSVAIVCQAMKDDKSVKALSGVIETMLSSLEALGLRLEFATRSEKIWKLAGRDATLQIIDAGASAKAADKKGRSLRITHLHLTEVAYYEYAEETLRGVLNCVPPEEQFSSVIVYECTANGAFGPFYEKCQSARLGEDGFRFHFFPWYVHEEYEVSLREGEVVRPKTEMQRLLVEKHGVGPSQLKWWQLQVANDNNDEEHVNQEYPSDPDTCFLVSGRTFFDKARVAAMLLSAEPPVAEQHIRASGVVESKDEVTKRDVAAYRVYHRPEKGRSYVVSVDTSEGVGGSAGSAVVYERGTGRHMATLWGQFPPWELARYAVEVAKKYGGALLVVERNNHGHTVLRCVVAEQRYRRVFVDHDKRAGFMTTPASRPVVLDTFEEAVRAGQFETNDVHLLREMRTFVIDERGKAKAAKGKRDDLVMASAIGYDIITRSAGRPTEDWVDELPAA